MRFEILFFAFILAVPTIAHAQEPNCDDQQTQFDLNVCSAKDLEKADTELNRVWKEVFNELKKWDVEVRQDGSDAPSRAEALLASQRAWIDYRDGHCEAEANAYHGGSILPLIRNTCLTTFTQKRTVELLSLVQEN